MRDQIEKFSKEVAGRPVQTRRRGRGRRKRSLRINTTSLLQEMVGLLPAHHHFVSKLRWGEINGSFNRCCNGGKKSAIEVEPPKQSLSKKAKTTIASSSTEVAPRLRHFITQKSDEVALKVLMMLPPEVLLQPLSTSFGWSVGSPSLSLVNALMSS